VTASLKALLAGVVDYAGMFPPASLELVPAVQNFARYRDERDGWMLGRFVCPASRLNELLPRLSQVTAPGRPLLVAALGRGPAANGDDGVKGVRQDLECIRAFRAQARNKARVDVFEARLPTDDLEAAQRAVKEITRAAKVGLRPFCEIPLTADFSEKVRPILQLLVDTGELAAKLRCGGADAGAIPSAQQVATMIVACRDAHVPLKFTAGLHHPIRHNDEAMKAKMHGFINVFVAGVLARVGHRDEAELVKILEDENPASFTFFDYGLAWQTTKAMTAQVTAVRRDGLISFGSCSFDDPRDDLRKHGWL
jgi:hypothetical protein